VKKKNMYSKVGSWAFIAGLIIAIIISLAGAFSGQATPPAIAALIIAIVGIIVGLLNVMEHEVNQFLIASIAFLISFAALDFVVRSIPVLNAGGVLSTFLTLLQVFVAPAAAIVSIKAIYNISKDQ
jgi:uncharacterized membrane protein YczE